MSETFQFSKYAVTICTFLEVCLKVCIYPASHVTLKVWPITFHYSVKWPKFHGLVSQGFCWPIFVRQLDNCKLLILPRQFWQIFDYLTICTSPFSFSYLVRKIIKVVLIGCALHVRACMDVFLCLDMNWKRTLMPNDIKSDLWLFLMRKENDRFCFKGTKDSRKLWCAHPCS